MCLHSRNQLSTLPTHLCSLPLKVLIACNNKLVSLPEELGQLRQLTELVRIGPGTLNPHSYGYYTYYFDHLLLVTAAGSVYEQVDHF